MTDRSSKPKKPPRSRMSRAGGRSLVSYKVGALPLVNELLDRMCLSQYLRGYLPKPDRRSKVDAAEGLLVLLRNILVSREPIYGLGEWAEQFDPKHLGLLPEQVSSLNDDRVGRCLDRLFDAEYRSMILAIAAHVVKEFDVALDELHNDSTTISFFGAYDEAGEGSPQRGKPTLRITWGHSKGHRPDLKQLLFILTVSLDGAVPIYFTAADGNITDDQTHRDTWDLLCRLSGRNDFLYVADSKLATRENMDHIARNGGRFLTVLPRTRGEDHEFRERVARGEIVWKDLYTKRDEEDNLIDVFEVSDHPALSSEGYRLVWYRSVRKQEMDARSRSQRIERGLRELAEFRDRLRSPRTRWRERAKVAAKVEKILGEHEIARWIHVEILEDSEKSYRQRRPGRPGKDTSFVRHTKTRFDLRAELDHDALAQEALSDGVFPLVTNETSLSECDLLLKYKKQPLLEKRFAQIKTDFEIAPVFLKNVARIEALLCVYFLALLVQSLLEREIRRAMEDRGVESLPLYPENRRCRRPCARRIIDLFDNVQRHELKERGCEPAAMMTELSQLQRRILRLLDVPQSSYQLA